MPKFEVCAVLPMEPQMIEADSLEEACEIASEMILSDFIFFGLEITDVYEVEEGD